MEIREYQNIFEQEENHFFYVSLHRMVMRLIEKYSAGRLEILDAGCGTGGLMKMIAKYGAVKGIDFSLEAVRLSRKRKLKVEQASVLKLPFKAKTFDLVTCIDVLYHRSIVSDVKAMSELKRVLKKNGILIIRVQADKSLKTAHDRFVHSRRRYTLEELIRKLKKTGLEIELISYIHSPLWPIAKIKMMVEKIINDKSSESGVVALPRPINQLLTWILNRESDLVLKGFRPPFGQGIIAVCRKSI